MLGPFGKAGQFERANRGGDSHFRRSSVLGARSCWSWQVSRSATNDRSGRWSTITRSRTLRNGHASRRKTADDAYESDRSDSSSEAFFRAESAPGQSCNVGAGSCLPSSHHQIASWKATPRTGQDRAAFRAVPLHHNLFAYRVHSERIGRDSADCSGPDRSNQRHRWQEAALRDTLRSRRSRN